MVGAVVSIILFLFLINTPNKNEVEEVKWLEDERYDFVTFATEGEAVDKANEIGCVGFHTHEQNGQTIFMACEKHSDLDPFVLGTTEMEQSDGLY